MQWKQWAQTCASEMSRAKAAQREAEKAHDQQSIEMQIKKTQSGYMRNQKKTHKMILGKGSQHSLGAVRDSDTKELHTDPEKIKESVQKFYQHLADPATSAGKTGAFLPEEAPRQYPLEHGPKAKIILILRLMLANRAYQTSALRTTLETNQSCRGYYHT
ncbi:TPA: hypothetical protein ACH3X1_008491 [Trebouxia sp. C0004]